MLAMGLLPNASLAQDSWSISPNVIAVGKPTAITLTGPTAADVTHLHLEPGGAPKSVPVNVDHVALRNVDDNAALRLAKKIARECALTQAITLNSLLIIGCGKAGLRIYDSGGDKALLWRSSHSQLGNVQWIRLVDEQAVLVINDERIARVVDVSDPTQPLVSYSFRLAFMPTNVNVVKQELFVSDRTRAMRYRLDTLPPQYSNENLNGGEGVNFGGQRRGAIIGNTLYVADWFSGIHIYDLSKASRPRLLSSYHTPGSPKGIVVRDNIAYVADDDHGLHLVDVSNPHVPTHITTIATAGLAYTPLIENNLLYLASHRGGFQIFNLTDPRAPLLLSITDTPGKAWSIAVQNQYAYVADSEAGLLIYDVSDAAQPKHIGTFAPGGNVEEVIIDGPHAYVALFDNGVYVLDVNVPAQPRVLSHFATPGNARGLFKINHSLWVADWLAGVHQYDVSNPSHPQLQASFDTPGAAWGIRVQNDVAYVFDWWGGLQLLHTHERGLLAPLAVYNQQTPFAAYAGAGRYLYAAQHDLGLQVFDINNPLNPTWITGLELPGTALDVATHERMAYVALGAEGVAAIDIVDPFRPRLLKMGHSPFKAQRINLHYPWLTLAEDAGTLSLYHLTSNRALDSAILMLPNIVDSALTATDLYFVDTKGTLWKTPTVNPTHPAHWLDDAQIKQIRASAEVVVALTSQHELLMLDPQFANTVWSRLKLDAPVIHIALQNSILYVTTPDEILTVHLRLPTKPNLGARYPIYRTLKTITPYRGALYGSGSTELLAIMPLPTLDRANASSLSNFVLPAHLPEGTYHLRAIQGTAPPVHIENALRVQGLQFQK